MTLASGSRLGPYEVVAPLGAGGMGEVYRATDTRLKRQVALKVLPESVATDPERLARFQREAEVLAALNHPNIAQIHGLEEGRALVIELVEGLTLAERIAQGPIPADEALAIARQIAAALAAAHERAIVHRDLKPANIKVRPDGTVKVLDFGLAKLNDPTVANDSHAPNSLSLSPTMTSPALATGVGTLMGTAAYMSPEQARGRAVDKRADIWAFGVVLYEMLTGQPLFGGDTVTDVLAAVVTRTPDLQRLPPTMRPLLAACLQQDPAQRLRDIGDAELLLDDGPARARDDAATAPAVRARVAWAVAALFAVAAAGFGVLYLQRPEPPPSDRAVLFETTLPPGAVAGRPSLSPDGTMFVYQSPGSDGRLMMHLRRLDSLDARGLAGTDMTAASELIWSPDSRHVGFAAGDGSFRRVSLPDGPVETIFNTGEHIGGAWSDAGIMLLGSRSGGLRRVSIANGSVANATTIDRSLGDAADRNPTFLPDGRHFIFRRLGEPARNGLWIGSLDPQTAPRKLADAIAGGFAGELSGLGPTLILLRGDRVFAQQIDLGRLTLVGEPRPLVTVSGQGVSASLNGVLAYAGAAGRQRSQVRWYDRAGRVVASDDASHPYQSIDLSPDGRHLLSGRFAEQTNLWLEDLTRGTETRLTSRFSNSALWSPDGVHVAFNSPRDGLSTIHRVAANGTGAEEIVLRQDRDVWANDWSRDGRFLLYSTPAADVAAGLDVGYVHMQDPKRPPAPYLTDAFTQKQAQFSPDGRFVAYISDETGRFEVYVRTFPDPAAGKWPISADGGVEPRWSRDGRELFYWSGRTLHVVDVRTKPAFSAGIARKLFDAPILAGYINDAHRWQVSPDGRRFLVLALQDDAAATIRVIVNWPALLRGPGPAER